MLLHLRGEVPIGEKTGAGGVLRDFIPGVPPDSRPFC
jgi:hypothetical protein